MFLAGTYELTIDAKNRLSIPFNIRRKLDPNRDGHSFYVLPGARKGTLALYPEVYFEQLRPVPREETLSDDTQGWRRFEFSQCALLEPDAQGRILLPERALKKVGVGKDVVLIGVQDHLELWDRAQFEEFEKEQWARFSENRAKAMQELRTLTSPPSANASTA